MELPNLDYYQPMFMYVREGCMLVKRPKEFLEAWFKCNRDPCKCCEFCKECIIDFKDHPLR